MRARILVCLLPALLAGACLLLVPRKGDGAQAKRRPNFIIVLADDLGYGDLGCYGNQTIRTPNLDRFAANGLRLTNCYSSAPVCSPSRAGMLTGRIPYRAGIYDWIPPGSPVHLRKEEVTVSKLLQQAGYATAHVGKWHCNGMFNRPEQPQPDGHGFSHWFSTQNNAGPSHRDPINFVRNGKRVGPLKGYSSQLIVDEALAWLKEQESHRRILEPRDQSPFCLFVWFHSPHEPVATDEKFIKMYREAGITNPEQANYYGNVTELDDAFGRLMKAMDGFDFKQDTFVMFSSDNGPEYRGKHSFGSPGPLRGKKLHMYEGGFRVPGILQWPGRITPGQRSDEPVTNLDLMPTLCSAASVKVPGDRPLDGVSLLPLFKRQALKRSVPLYWQYDLAHGGPTVAMREGDWKILAYRDLDRFELYNLKKDPAETVDLASKEPERTGRMTAKMLKLHAEIKKEGPQWPPDPPRPAPRAQ